MNLAEELQSLFDNHLTDLGPTITHLENGNIEINWSSNNDGHASITFTLSDIGDPTVKHFDLDIAVSNCDNVGPKDMLAQTTRCMQQFYDMGLNTKFGQIIGDC